MLKPNVNQFQPNSNNQVIVDLQSNVASLQKRVDELEKSGSGTNAVSQIRSIQSQISELKGEIDNAAKSGTQEVTALSKQFKALQSSVTEFEDTLSKKVGNLDSDLKANTTNDNIHQCLLYLLDHQHKKAADVAGKLTNSDVEQVMKDYYNPDSKNKEERKEILSEFINCIKDGVKRNSYKTILDNINHQILQGQQLFIGGTLLSNKDHQIKLNEFYGKFDQQWELAYKATKDGFGSQNFRDNCDGQAPTMIIIQSKEGNYLFGAYTSLRWCHNRGYKQDTNGFLFTLINPNKIPPTKYAIATSKSDTAVYHSGAGFLGEYYDNYLFGFGGEGLHFFNFNDNFDGLWGTRRGDLFITSDSNKSNSSSIRFPCSYIDTTKFGDKTFTDATFFTVNDIEVYTFKKQK
ncbi:unnamed protein product [Adineta steineri]|uniref:TLDc domain-containing protein n=1 Tax=Adineta steineri TaxID=433720 RepID=A0A819LHU6_9BILA|nr:unnamed protein product [Adineta steineri]CAF3966239.1 unnamed protein product [Adineta steineri]